MVSPNPKFIGIRDEDSARKYYSARFSYVPKRDSVWSVIASYLQGLFSHGEKVLEIGAGYCAWINNVKASEKHALDIYPDFAKYGSKELHAHVGNCDNLSQFKTNEFDSVLASNLLEHLSDDALVKTCEEVFRILKPGGKFIVIQPNFSISYRNYFDDYTHMKVFTHISLPDFLCTFGFNVLAVQPRFMPFSFKKGIPVWPWLVHFYLRLPYRPFAGQMLIVTEKD
jgi:ubiquinone/menaquinone biosynthesis C-methylase UbiE